MTWRNHLSWRNDQAFGFRPGRPGRTIQVEDEAGGRERGASATVDCFAAQAPWSRPAYKRGSLVFYPALPLVSVHSSGSYNHPPRDAHPLAPVGLSLLLALEVTIFGRPAADRGGAARVC